MKKYEDMNEEEKEEFFELMSQVAEILDINIVRPIISKFEELIEYMTPVLKSIENQNP